ncbi:phosphotransferase [Paenibacillus albidus]|nr:phosphotransferase [Paenibacillus albidus]
MYKFFQLDTADNRRKLLSRARQVALTAIQMYELEWERIRFIQLSDTITYKMETATGKYLLRIHSDQYSKEQISSELDLLKELNKSDDLTVPEGIASSDGSYVLEINTEAGYCRPCVTIMRWVEGEHAGGQLTDNCIFRMGVLMGRIHQVAGRFSPPPAFNRPVWGADSFSSKMAQLERSYTCFLSDKAWQLYQAAANKILSQLVLMDPNDNSYGLIHADLHMGNYVFNEELPYAIDFGRCGYGYFLYDLASTILGLKPEDRRTFIQGYESVKTLQSDFTRYLECFFVMVMIENYCHHAADPRETSNLISEQPYAQAYLREFLSDTSFIFDMIQPERGFI